MVSVALLSEKVTVIGKVIDPQEIIDRIDMLGFEAEEIKEFQLTEGEVTLELKEDTDSGEVKDALKHTNGVIDVDKAGNLLTVNYDPDAIKAREVAIVIQGITGSIVRVFISQEDQPNMIEQQRQSMNEWLRQFLLSCIFTIPIFVASMILSNTVSAESLTARKASNSNLPIWNMVMWILATPVQFIFGYRFYRGAYKSLTNGSANMDVLVVLGTTSAYGFGMLMAIMYAAGMEQTAMNYLDSAHSFETSALLISIILLGKFIESKSKHRTTDAISRLASLQSATAIYLQGDQEHELDLKLLEIGNKVRVYPGASVPVDGLVISGEGWVNEAMMTGESLLVRKVRGSSVFGGTLNTKGSFDVEVTKLGKESALSQIISLVENAQATKTPIQDIADRISKVFVPVVILLACITWAIWFSVIYNRSQQLEDRFKDENESEFVFAFKFGISVLVIACPCALGLATPTAVMVASGVAAKYGVLIKGGEALERASKIHTIIFDKTGTLTSGFPKITNFVPLIALKDDTKACALIATAESKSEHPIAKAICTYFKGEGSLTSFDSIEGEGVKSTIELEGKSYEVLVGNTRLMQNNHVELDQITVDELERLESEGKTVVACVIDSVLTALIAMRDESLVKPRAREVIMYLRSNGYNVWMLTGDNENCARVIADEVGIPIENVVASCLPFHKKFKVQELQGQNPSFEGETEEELLADKKTFGGVAFVGDGINDSPSLAQADVGIAIGATDIAMDAASIVLMKDSLDDVVIALSITKVALRRIRLNFFWAFIYNLVGIPIAAGILYIGLGFRLDSIYSASAMAMSSVCVVLSSLHLNTYKPPVF